MKILHIKKEALHLPELLLTLGRYANYVFLKTFLNTFFYDIINSYLLFMFLWYEENTFPNKKSTFAFSSIHTSNIA
jgi:hypothetical protein